MSTSCDIVLDWMRRHGKATSAQVRDGTGLTQKSTNAGLRSALKFGFVTRDMSGSVPVYVWLGDDSPAINQYTDYNADVRVKLKEPKAKRASLKRPAIELLQERGPMTAPDMARLMRCNVDALRHMLKSNPDTFKAGPKYVGTTRGLRAGVGWSLVEQPEETPVDTEVEI